MATKSKPESSTVDSFRQIDRLVNFSDAVMSIAATLLILPMVDDISKLHTITYQSLRASSGHEFIILVLSFIVICRFWVIHNNLFSPLKKFDSPIFWLNALWLLTIVILPFSTELLGKSNHYSALTTGIYIGTMAVTTYTALLLQWRIMKSPKLQKDSVGRKLSLVPYIAASIIMTTALLIAVLAPFIGVWSLLLLLFSGPVSKSLEKRHF